MLLVYKSGNRSGHGATKTDLAGLHAACEANYLRLMRLFPDYEQSNCRDFTIGPARVHMEVLERSRYTTFFRLQQSHGGSRWLDSVKDRCPGLP